MISALHRTKLFLLILLVASSGLLASCGTKLAEEDHAFSMASLADMPADVQAAPDVVQQAYRFAAANAEVMQQIPCYCGCGSIGHTSNYACYVSGVDGEGKISYDAHALGCSICVDITQDTKRMLEEGLTMPEIKAAIHQTYAQYGPSNNP